VHTKPDDAAARGASSAVAPRTTDEDSIFVGLEVEDSIEASSGGGAPYQGPPSATGVGLSTLARSVLSVPNVKFGSFWGRMSQI
jgi:hypothetical protein